MRLWNEDTARGGGTGQQETDWQSCEMRERKKRKWRERRRRGLDGAERVHETKPRGDREGECK